MLVFLFPVTFVLVIFVVCFTSSLQSFSGLLCVVIDVIGSTPLGLLPLASSIVEDDAVTPAPLSI